MKKQCNFPGCQNTALYIAKDGGVRRCAYHMPRMEQHSWDSFSPPVQEQPQKLDVHYVALSPEPIEVMSKWGLTGPFACASILKLVARIWACNRPDAPKTTGYNGRGSREDITKLRFYVDQLEQWLLSLEPKQKEDNP